VILVTGASGLLGRNIQEIVMTKEKNKQLNLEGLSQNFVFHKGRKNCDFTDAAKTKDYLLKVKPKKIIHCAAYVGGLFHNMDNNEKFFELNSSIDRNILMNAKELGVKEVICILSTCVFPDKIEYPLTEDKIMLGEPHSSNWGYS